MLKREEYIKAVSRPYPPLFVSIFMAGMSEPKHFKAFIPQHYVVINLVHSDGTWFYSKAELARGGGLTFK